MNNFQTILVAVFLAFFVFAVLIFSGILNIGGSSKGSGPTGKVVVWGTFNTTPEFIKVFEDLNGNNKDLSVTYVKQSEATYKEALIESFASDTGPDVFLVSPDMIEKFRDYVYKIPYTRYPKKNFTDSFIDGATVYLTHDGIIGLPVVVDPLMLYYNKDIFSNAGLVKPPQYWDELSDLNAKLTNKKDDGTILQSMVALGRYDNISHSKDILATLLLQSGNSIVENTDSGYLPVLNKNTTSLPISSAEQVLNFFTPFSNPSYDVYSWNRSLPKSLDMFTGGKLGMYVGPASELFTIESVNPNLSFDVSTILQTRTNTTKRTYGTIYAVAINKKSTNASAAFGVAGLLSSGDQAKNLGVALSLPPASRALLADKPIDPYLSTFFNSAIITRTWADPDAKASDGIFAELIQNIVSNKLSVGDALNKAQGQLEFITKK